MTTETDQPDESVFTTETTFKSLREVNDALYGALAIAVEQKRRAQETIDAIYAIRGKIERTEYVALKAEFEARGEKAPF